MEREEDLLGTRGPPHSFLHKYYMIWMNNKGWRGKMLIRKLKNVGMHGGWVEDLSLGGGAGAGRRGETLYSYIHSTGVNMSNTM